MVLSILYNILLEKFIDRKSPSDLFPSEDWLCYKMTSARIS
ncbi:hypothetical protein CLOL250_00018 [Clostridium sp. L2-50]|nr:hypothetical protein CLOL250_00018 [Clostridium sp. L2-50]